MGYRDESLPDAYIKLTTADMDLFQSAFQSGNLNLKVERIMVRTRQHTEDVVRKSVRAHYENRVKFLTRRRYTNEEIENLENKVWLCIRDDFNTMGTIFITRLKV